MGNLKYAFKYLLKSNSNQLVRVASLAIGLCVGLVIFSYINFNLSFNSFLPDKNQIFQVWEKKTVEGKIVESNLVKSTVGSALKEEIPEVEASTFVRGPFVNDYFVGDKAYTVKFLHADTSFFSVLAFKVLAGDPKKVLISDDKVMISSSLAKRMFGEKDPIGQIVGDTFGNKFIVEGIFKEVPLNNSFGQFDMVFAVSLSRFSTKFGWSGNDDFQNFIKLKDRKDVAKLDAIMPSFYKKYQIEAQMKQFQSSYYFIPIDKTATVGNKVLQMSILLGLLGLISLLVAGLNYVLISISSLIGRAKSVSMLKCNGATNRDILSIFMWETALVLLVSFMLSVLLIFILKDSIEKLCGIPVEEFFQPDRLWVFGLVSLALFLISGLIPANIFKSVPVAVAFRGLADGKKRWKQVLLFCQLTIMSFVFVLMAIIYLQFNNLSKGDFGYSYDKLVTVAPMTNPQGMAKYEDMFRSLPFVESVGTAFNLPCYGYDSKPCYDETTREVLFDAKIGYITPGYIPTMGMRIVEGRNFTDDVRANEVVVNQKYVEMRRWSGTPIGRQIVDSNAPDSPIYTIIGVVNDFRVEASTGAIKPLVFHSIYEKMSDANSFYGGQRLMIRLSSMSAANLQKIEKVLGEMKTINNDKVDLYGDSLNETLEPTKKLKNFIAIVTLVSLLLVLAGIVGYMNDEVRRRSKEVAIRKINGADMLSILKLIATDLAYVMIPALVLGNILGYLVGSHILQDFASKIPLSWWIFASCSIVVLLINYLVQVLKTWRIANSNPVAYLKSE